MFFRDFLPSNKIFNFINNDVVSIYLCGGGFGFGLGRVKPSDSQIFSKADTTASGAFYRTGASAITPVRTGSFSFVRVG